VLAVPAACCSSLEHPSDWLVGRPRPIQDELEEILCMPAAALSCGATGRVAWTSECWRSSERLPGVPGAIQRGRRMWPMPILCRIGTTAPLTSIVSGTEWHPSLRKTLQDTTPMGARQCDELRSLALPCTRNARGRNRQACVVQGNRVTRTILPTAERSTAVHPSGRTRPAPPRENSCSCFSAMSERRSAARGTSGRR
jgi:hypothetical protein